jgi:antitoxin (DNA-binding transcriptional repressor) of toxin-antitoxin stability system
MTRVATETIQQIWEKYFHEVDEGESILLTKNDMPIAEICPVNAEGKKLRPRGLAKGEFTVPDNIDEPLPDEVLKLFTLE